MASILSRPLCVKDFISQMRVPLENSVYFGDGDSFNSNPEYIPVKLPWIFPGAPLNFNGDPGNIQGNLDRHVTVNISMWSPHYSQSWQPNHNAAHFYTPSENDDICTKCFPRLLESILTILNWTLGNKLLWNLKMSTQRQPIWTSLNVVRVNEYNLNYKTILTWLFPFDVELYVIEGLCSTWHVVYMFALDVWLQENRISGIISKSCLYYRTGTLNQIAQSQRLHTRQRSMAMIV